MPYILISGNAIAFQDQPDAEEPVQDSTLLSSLHGLCSDESCLEYLDLGDMENIVTGGGRLRFIYSSDNNQLLITTAIDLTRELSTSERDQLVNEVTAQWSDGVGTGSFSNHEFEVLSASLALAIRNSYGDDAEIGDIFVEAAPFDIEQEIQVQYFPQGNADDDHIADLTNAAASGNTAAMILLAQMYEAGDGLPQDDQLAFRYFSDAAKLGNPFGMTLTGRFLHAGKGCTANQDAALEYFHKAIEMDFPLAMHCLGDCYANGQGVPLDPPKAIEWYQRGAVLNDAGCLAQLGDCYEYGNGTDIDLSKALEYYEQALGLGFDAVEDAIERVRKARRR